jgi:16S rRNA (adenine1518-N6/adenine1519-N6)-dimethyltransferase
VAVEEKALFRLVRAAFNQRRKTLVNALDGVCGKERARQALEACGFSPTVRGEALSLADFAALTMELENN